MRIFQRNSAATQKQNSSNSNRNQQIFHEEEPNDDFQGREVDAIQKKLQDMHQVFQRLPKNEDENLDVQEALKVAEQIRQLADSLTGITGPKHPAIGTSFSIESKNLLPKPGRYSESSSRAFRDMTLEKRDDDSDQNSFLSETSFLDQPVSPSLARTPKGDVARKIALMETIWTESKTLKASEKRAGKQENLNSQNNNPSNEAQDTYEVATRGQQNDVDHAYTGAFSGVSALVERWSRPMPTKKSISSKEIDSQSINKSLNQSATISQGNVNTDGSMIEILTTSSENSRLSKRQQSDISRAKHKQILQQNDMSLSTANKIFRAIEEKRRSKSVPREVLPQAKSFGFDDERSKKSLADSYRHQQKRQPSRTSDKHSRNDSQEVLTQGDRSPSSKSFRADDERSRRSLGECYRRKQSRNDSTPKHGNHRRSKSVSRGAALFEDNRSPAPKSFYDDDERSRRSFDESYRNQQRRQPNRNDSTTPKQIFHATEENSISKVAHKFQADDERSRRSSSESYGHRQTRQPSTKSGKLSRNDSRSRSTNKMNRRISDSACSKNSADTRQNSIENRSESASRAESRTHMISLPVSFKRSKSEIRIGDEKSTKSNALSSTYRIQQIPVSAPVLEIVALNKKNPREPSSFNPQAEWDYRNPHYSFDYQPGSPSANYRSIKSHGSTVSSLSTRSLRAARIRKKIWKMICGKVNEPKRIDANQTITTAGDHSMIGSVRKKSAEGERLHNGPSLDLNRSNTFAGTSNSKSFVSPGNNGIRRASADYDVSHTKNNVSFSEYVAADEPRLKSEYYSDYADVSRSKSNASPPDDYDLNINRNPSNALSTKDYSLRQAPSTASRSKEFVTSKHRSSQPSNSDKHSIKQTPSKMGTVSSFVDEKMSRKEDLDESRRLSVTSIAQDDAKSHASMSNLSGSTGAFSIAELVKYMSFKENLERGFEILLNDSEGFRQKYFPSQSEQEPETDDRVLVTTTREREYVDADKHHEFIDSPSMTMAAANGRHRATAANSTNSSTERTQRLLETLETPRGTERSRSKDQRHRGQPSIEHLPSRNSFDRGYNEHAKKRSPNDHYSYYSDDLKPSGSNPNSRSRDLVRE